MKKYFSVQFMYAIKSRKRNLGLTNSVKNLNSVRHQWLMPVSLTTWEAEIRKIEVQDPISKIPNTKKKLKLKIEAHNPYNKMIRVESVKPNDNEMVDASFIKVRIKPRKSTITYLTLF
jgi:hypothetical protein